MLKHLKVKIISNAKNYIYCSSGVVGVFFLFKSQETKKEYPEFLTGHTYIIQIDNKILLRAIKL